MSISAIEPMDLCCAQGLVAPSSPQGVYFAAEDKVTDGYMNNRRHLSNQSCHHNPA